MKKNITISLAILLLLGTMIFGWTKTGNEQHAVGDIQIKTGSIVTSTGAVSESGISLSGTEIFKTEYYLNKGINSIISKTEKGDIVVYIGHIVTGAKVSDCFDSTPCASFVTKGGVLKYTNMKAPGKIEYENLDDGKSNGKPEISDNGIIFQIGSGSDWGQCNGSDFKDMVYIDLDSMKKIYEKSDNSGKCTEFYDENHNSLNLKSTDITAAYKEYYK